MKQHQQSETGNAKGSILLQLVDEDNKMKQNQQNNEDATPTHKGANGTHTREQTNKDNANNAKRISNLMRYYNEEEQKDKRKGGELSRACLAEGKTRAQATLPLEGPHGCHEGKGVRLS